MGLTLFMENENCVYIKKKKYRLGDKIIAKKMHPCGSNEWTIIRVGADMKLKCDKCGHILMVGIDKFPKMIKKHLSAED